ncbi:hypothetical protein A5662_23610 [Mycobacteriaceae bacterium 1482268.1]|nr:hypothetical protein A5662_23610 [Mycobacteriaceae bacterium 1482268.1]
MGSGYRAKNAFLPALHCLDPAVEVVGIHSRNVDHAREAGRQFGAPAIEDLRSLRPGDVDMVLVSVTPTSNLAVLRATAHIAPGAALVIDTPAVSGLADLRHLGLYRRWRTVRVAEDFMNMPQFRLVEKVIDSNALGDVVHLRLTNMGWAYHALALSRSWLRFPLVRSARSHRRGRGEVDITYRFPNGVTAEVIEPYTRGEGFFEVVGRRASLAGHMMGFGLGNSAGSLDQTAVGARGRLERLEDENGLSGFQIVGLDGGDITTGIPFLPRLRAMNLEDDSEFNLIRIDGLCQVISSLWSPDPVNSKYRLQEAMTDVVVSFLARVFPWWPVPRIAGHNLVDLLESAANPLDASARRSDSLNARLA